MLFFYFKEAKFPSLVEHKEIRKEITQGRHLFSLLVTVYELQYSDHIQQSGHFKKFMGSGMNKFSLLKN